MIDRICRALLCCHAYGIYDAKVWKTICGVCGLNGCTSPSRPCLLRMLHQTRVAGVTIAVQQIRTKFLHSLPCLLCMKEIVCVLEASAHLSPALAAGTRESGAHGAEPRGLRPWGGRHEGPCIWPCSQPGLDGCRVSLDTPLSLTAGNAAN